MAHSAAYNRQNSYKTSQKLGRISRMSVTSVRSDEEALIDNEVEEVSKKPGFGALMKLNAPEWYWIILAIIAATMVSGSFPTFAIYFGEMIAVLSEPTDQMVDDAVFWSCMFLVLGGTIGIGFALEMLFLSISGENLTERLRYTVFESILEQDIEYFDRPDNSTGALTAKLSKDASLIQG